jgi:hypothetical protein
VNNRTLQKYDDYRDYWVIDKLFDGIFGFPEELFWPRESICGMILFPNMYTYKVKINSYRSLTDAEWKEVFPICNTMIMSSPISPNKYIVVESLSKIE